MKKLRLDLDSLNVQSFATGAGSAGGTVNAHFGGLLLSDPIDTDTSKIDSCYFDTCYDTCNWETQ